MNVCVCFGCDKLGLIGVKTTPTGLFVSYPHVNVGTNL